TEEDVKKHLEELRKTYYDARHHCYSYILNPDKSAFRINDDGEPSGSAGKPIHGQLLSFDLTNILVVVIRYFGGTKLGIPGLIQAYRESTKSALGKAKIAELFVQDIYAVWFQYPDMNIVMRILKDEHLKPFDQDFKEDCQLKFAIRQKESDRLFQKFKVIHTLKIKYVQTI
ncbi:MAG: YigZ family protein, partial [Bacteroidales bacterium]|nr:YigZ family protein [Bacteroidales bacterium]